MSSLIQIIVIVLYSYPQSVACHFAVILSKIYMLYNTGRAVLLMFRAHQAGMSLGGTKNPPTNPATALNTGDIL